MHRLQLVMIPTYLQVQTLMLQLAKDPSQDVVDTAFEQLLPALLAWMADTDLLYTALLPAILTDIRASVERSLPAYVACFKHVHLPCMSKCTCSCSNWQSMIPPSALKHICTTTLHFVSQLTQSRACTSCSLVFVVF